MIHIVKGNLLESDCNVIAHQVNCMGVMGAGIAAKIKQKYPWAYRAYYFQCRSHLGAHELLGTAQIVPEPCEEDEYRRIPATRLRVVHLYGQYKYGRERQHTVYQAVEDALHLMLRNLHQDQDLKIGLPYGMGCGLAGGNWGIVSEIIEKVFYFHRQDGYLYKL